MTNGKIKKYKKIVIIRRKSKCKLKKNSIQFSSIYMLHRKNNEKIKLFVKFLDPLDNKRKLLRFSIIILILSEETLERII